VGNPAPGRLCRPGAGAAQVRVTTGQRDEVEEPDQVKDATNPGEFTVTVWKLLTVGSDPGLNVNFADGETPSYRTQVGRTFVEFTMCSHPTLYVSVPPTEFVHERTDVPVTTAA
jgi:hypothetical protein